MEKNKRGFASDNNAGVHPQVLKAIADINTGHVVGYGDDNYTAEAIELMKKHFGKNIEVYFVFTGTGANVLGFKAVSRSYNSIICAESSHINVDECGAPEKFTGCKLLSIDSTDGKISVDKIKKHMHGIGFEHHSQPRVISITQSTEVGTVYKPEEIEEIADFAHTNNLVLHMDGARLSNAVVNLDTSFKALTADTGVDLLSFGLTKNGAMLAEAVVFFDQKLCRDFKYIRKQGMQLGSKMRFMAVQFTAMFRDEIWKKNALHANEMAKLLAEKISVFPEVKITQKVESNGVFAIIPEDVIKPLQKEFFFYVWDEDRSEVRWMTSFDTTRDDINRFVDALKQKLRCR